MHDLATIHRLNQESSTNEALQAHVAAGGHAVAEYAGLHLTGWHAFADRESANDFAAANGRVGITLEAKHPRVPVA